jgi:putative transposase
MTMPSQPGFFVKYLLFSLGKMIQEWIKPTPDSVIWSVLADSVRSRRELIAENALLCQQVIILNRATKPPLLHKRDKCLLPVLARTFKHWKQALLIIQPDTLLRWHRELFRWMWKRKSKPKRAAPRLSQDTSTLMVQLVRENRLWGAERIRGELLKLGISASKRTIQRYRRRRRGPQPRSQTWKTSLHDQAAHL